MAPFFIASLPLQNACGQDAIDLRDYRPAFDAAAVAEPAAIVADGVLDEPAWARATVLTEFFQVRPTPGPPGQRTRALVLFDDAHLYVGVYAYDDDPSAIQANFLERDFAARDDDTVRVIIDPTRSRRDAYLFGVNPNGARVEGLIENNESFRKEWNAIWAGAAGVTQDGWIAEFAIPFRSISYDPSAEEWGFQIIRVVRRTNETIRWSSIERGRDNIDVATIGAVRGVRPPSQGLGLDVNPLLSFGWDRRWNDGGPDDDIVLKPSGNLFYKITPSLTGTLTFNTDFSDAPLDERKVNTGRFDLFFPETRDFFLQDVALFEFGGRTFLDDQNGQPFFSRRIGIVNGEPTDILAGAKLSGRIGPTSIGALLTRTKAAGEIDGQSLSVARIASQLSEGARVGIIATHGDPTGEAVNTVVGADLQYKNYDLIGEGVLAADFGYLRSWTDSAPADMFGSEIAYIGDRWNWFARLRNIDDGFDPRLGFANRTDIRRGEGMLTRTWRPAIDGVRKWDGSASLDLITNTSGAWLDREWELETEVELDSGDILSASYERSWTNVTSPFRIAGVVPVAPGAYEYSQYEAVMTLTMARKFAPRLEVKWGGVYDGDLIEFRPGLTLRPSRHFRLDVDYEFNGFSLPSGDVDIHIASVETRIDFDPKLQFLTQIQYDNISDAFAYLGQLRWEPRPDIEVLFTMRHDAFIENLMFPGDYQPERASATLRLSRTLRM